MDADMGSGKKRIIEAEQVKMVIALLLVAIVATLLLGLTISLTPVYARDVPFPTEHTVDGEFDGARDIYAADLDGDGDLDILGAAKYDTIHNDKRNE